MLSEQVVLEQSQGLGMPFERLGATMQTSLLLQKILDGLPERPTGAWGRRWLMRNNTVERRSWFMAETSSVLGRTTVRRCQRTLSLAPQRLAESSADRLSLAAGKKEPERG